MLYFLHYRAKAVHYSASLFSRRRNDLFNFSKLRQQNFHSRQCAKLITTRTSQTVSFTTKTRVCLTQLQRVSKSKVIGSERRKRQIARHFVLLPAEMCRLYLSPINGGAAFTTIDSRKLRSRSAGQPTRGDYSSPRRNSRCETCNRKIPRKLSA